jgi:hypothetical protein
MHKVSGNAEEPVSGERLRQLKTVFSIPKFYTRCTTGHPRFPLKQPKRSPAGDGEENLKGYLRMGSDSSTNHPAATTLAQVFTVKILNTIHD